MSQSNDKTGGFVSFPDGAKESPVPPEGNPESGGPPKPRGKSGNGRMLVFVIVFLAVAGGMIFGYRYVMDTWANHAYLYSVAEVTAFVLRPFTLSSEVEGGLRYQGQEREIRARLAAWNMDAEPAGPATSAAADGSASENASKNKPLSAFETFRYKTLIKETRYREQLAMIAAIEDYQASVVNSPEEELEALRGAIDHVQETGMQRRGPVAVNEAAQGIDEGLRNLERRLNELEANAGALVEQRQQVLDDVRIRFNELRGKQFAHLQQEAAQSYDRAIKNNGPLVTVLLRKAPGVKLQDLRRELGEVKQDGALSDEEKAQREAELKQQIAETEEQIASLPNGSDERLPLAFTFTLVPDCGAIPAMSIFVAAVVAFPAGWGRKLLGLLIGLPMLYMVNVVRLATLGYIGAVDRGGELFDFSHNFVWQGIYIVFVVVVWLLWVEIFVKKPQPKTAA